MDERRDERRAPVLEGARTETEICGDLARWQLLAQNRFDRVEEDRRQLREGARALTLDQRLEQSGQVPEVPVDDRPADACLARHGLDRDGVESVPLDDRLRHVEELLAPLLRGHAHRLERLFRGHR